MHNVATDVHSWATLVSLALTWPALTVCVLVVYSWFPQYRAYCKATNRRPSSMLIAGIWIAFLGSFVDNLWWGFAWTVDYLNHANSDPALQKIRDWLFHNGVYPNVFFRQGALIWAGVLHISAENMSRSTRSSVVQARINTKMFLGTSVVLSFIYITVLMSL